jgi:ferrochelatase
MPYQALLIVSFGGPECRDDVMPFLENVLRGRNVPRERMLEVAEHYYRFGGVSPINGQIRAMISALQKEFNDCNVDLPVYWGNRNWHPMLADTIQQMAEDGIERALTYVTSAFSCYSGCRQYRENVKAACDVVGPSAPQFDKLRVFFNHPGFVEVMVDRVRAAFTELPSEHRESTQIVYTAHSIPLAMASGAEYERQLLETSRLINEQIGDNPWKLVFQSRSGPPNQSWLEPDVCDHLRELHAGGQSHVVVVPIGFLSDHLEVIFDLDTEAKELCEQLGMTMVRAGTAGTHPAFIRMVRQLVAERMDDSAERMALGQLGPSHDVCPEDCCPSGQPPR